MEQFLVLFWRDSAAVRVESFVVVPGDPFHGGDGHVRDAFPLASVVDEFLLIEAVQRFRGSIVVTIALAADGADGADLLEASRVADRSVLNTSIGMVDEVVAGVPGA